MSSFPYYVNYFSGQAIGTWRRAEYGLPLFNKNNKDFYVVPYLRIKPKLLNPFKTQLLVVKSDTNN